LLKFKKDLNIELLFSLLVFIASNFRNIPGLGFLNTNFQIALQQQQKITNKPFITFVMLRRSV